MKVGIIGATGYGGADLIRILQTHPAVKAISLYTSSKEGRLISETYPHLTEIAPFPLEKIDPVAIANKDDLVFLATPSGVSSKLAPELLNAGSTVIDLSGDFRLKNPAQYEKWYNKAPGPDQWLEKAIYGLTEANREKVKEAKLLSNPGCYPTATLLGLLPLVKEEMLQPNSIIVDAKSGVSGAGRSPALGSLYSELNDNLKIYKVNEHQHIPEIEQVLKSWGYHSPITFHTHLVPMTRGIMATIYGTVKNKTTVEALLELYKEYYDQETFIRVREKGSFPATKEVSGSNYCDVGIAYDERTQRVTIVSVIDNVMKGAAGQAVQNANIMFGIEETTGLNFIPLYP